jgi:hypothetical protein
MKVAKANRGQFVIIAVLMIAIMIVSIGAVMHNAVTYYKSEPWEEYTTLVGNIELNSQRLLELSLDNYVQTGDVSIFQTNFDKWRTDLLSLYPGAGINLRYTMQDASIFSGSAHAKATFTLNITSIGLTGYKFTAEAFQ